MTKLTLKTTLSLETRARLDKAMGKDAFVISNTEEEKMAYLEKQGKDKSTSPELPGHQKSQGSGKEGKKPSVPDQKRDWKSYLAKITTVQEWLQQTWPAVFNLEEPKPLKRHIEQDIFPHLVSPMSKTQVRQALQAYVSRRAYLQALQQATHRYDLNGVEVEAIEDTQKAYTAERLEEKEKRFEAHQQRIKEKKAKQQAWREKQKAQKLPKEAGDKVEDKSQQ